MAQKYPNKQSNPAAAIPVWLAPAPAGAGLQVQNIPTSTGTLVKTGAGTFVGLSVNTAGTTSTAKIYDGIDNTGTLLGTFSTTAPGSNFPAGGWPFAIGLFVVTAGGAAADVTVSYF